MTKKDEKIIISSILLTGTLLMGAFLSSGGYLASDKTPEKIQYFQPTKWIDRWATVDDGYKLPSDSCDGDIWHPYENNKQVSACVDIDIITDNRRDPLQRNIYTRVRKYN